MYENRHTRVLPFRLFVLRVGKSALTALAFVVVSLAIGVLGYHLLERMAWIDSLLNASMLLGGMGPVGELHTTAGKLFASFYALFAGMIFLVVAGILFAPIVHRFLHRFHLEREREHEGQERAAARRAKAAETGTGRKPAVEKKTPGPAGRPASSGSRRGR